MMYFLLLIIVALGSLCLGARFHARINSTVARLLGKGEELPPDFQVWLAAHKGEYDSVGKAMSAWADARYGDKFNNMLK